MPFAGCDGHEDAIAVHNASAEEAMPNLQANLLGASHYISLIFGDGVLQTIENIIYV